MTKNKKIKKNLKAIKRRATAFILGITYKEYKRQIKKFRMTHKNKK